MGFDPNSRFEHVGSPSPAKAPRKVYEGDRFFVIDPDGTRTDITPYVGVFDRPEDFEGYPDKR